MLYWATIVDGKRARVVPRIEAAFFEEEAFPDAAIVAIDAAVKFVVVAVVVVVVAAAVAVVVVVYVDFDNYYADVVAVDYLNYSNSS